MLQTKNTDLPSNFWEVIEKHLPNYSQRDDVMSNQLLRRYVKGELDEDSTEYHGIKEILTDPQDALEISNRVLFSEAIEHRAHKIREAKELLEDAGYFVSGSWRTKDVQEMYECTDEEAQSVLDQALNSSEVMERIWDGISHYSDEMGLKEVE
jgi:hypothetical protein